MNTLFTTPQVSKVFGKIPTLKGTQGAAVQSTGNHFVGINSIMTEGKVHPDYIAFANEKLFEAKLAVDAAIAYGWNNGNTSDY